MFWIKSLVALSKHIKRSNLIQNCFFDYMHGLKSAILTFSRKGWDGCALLVRPSKMHHGIWKIRFVLSADEGWKAKFESAHSFLLKYSKMTVC